MAPWVKWPTSKSRSARYLLTVCGHFVMRFYDDVRRQRYYLEDNENARSNEIFCVSCFSDVISDHQKIVV